MKKFLFAISFVIIYLFSSLTPTSALVEDLTESSAEEKVVYLTFDDAPAPKITTKILDILAENDVKATFFVIGQNVKGNEDILKRMIDEGHSIGLHSYTHDGNKLYSSNQNCLDEMIKAQNEIFNATGYKSNILRFPFGCNNSRYKLKQNMVDMLHQNDLYIYDWNVDSGDGINSKLPPEKLYKNSITDKPRAFVLMHASSINKNTTLALPNIIKYYKDNGYTFKIIDKNTKEVFRLKIKH